MANKVFWCDFGSHSIIYYREGDVVYATEDHKERYFVSGELWYEYPHSAEAAYRQDGHFVYQLPRGDKPVLFRS